MSLKEEISLAISKRPDFLDQEIAFDIVFVMHVSGRGWILEKICRKIAEESNRSYTFVYSERNDSITGALPRGRSYFFAHYAIYTYALAQHPELHAASLFVWFTHPDFGKGIGIDDLVFALKQADLIFTANAQHGAALEILGLSRSRIKTIYGGADPEVFRSKPRGGGKVAFVGAYYERKQPDKLLETIRSMPDIQFMLLGPDASSVENKGLLWSNYSGYSDLLAMPNLEIIETAYENYAVHFEKIDVYVSLSRLEGGPIPLIEALMANAVPVVTRTGFCEELVQNGENGILLDIEASVDEIAAGIRQALELPIDVSVGTEALSWSTFGKLISREMRFPHSGNFEVSFGRGESGARRYLREGWDVPERIGAWQFSSEATILLPLKAGEALSSLNLKFRSGQVFGDIDKLEIHLLLNGHLLCLEKVRQSRQCQISVQDIPIELSQISNKLIVRVTTPVQLLEGAVPQLIRLEQLSGTTLPSAAEADKEKPLRRRFNRRRDSSHLIQQGVSIVAEEHEYEEVIPTEFYFFNRAIDLHVPIVGWHEPEAGGVWSAQKDSYVVLPLSPSLPDYIRVTITGRIYEPELSKNSSIAIGISDGEVEQQFDFGSESGESRDFSFVYQKLSRRQVIQIRFSLLNISSPYSLNIDAEDRRDLGFFLNKIILDGDVH
jgi:glycosyltransferase involved in cell wall biosynthesis